MNKSKKYDNYPLSIVFISNLVTLLIYVSGLFIMMHLGWIAAVLYLIYIIFLEYRLISRHCINCFYWGKICGFGKGKLSSFLFKKGNASDFCLNEMTWKDMIPDILVSFIPFATGIVLLIIRFDIIILAAIILIVLLSTSGNGFIRGRLTCRHCIQKDLGCPADKLFNKDNKQKK